MGEFLVALGRGLVKFVIGALGGASVGSLIFGLTTRSRPDIWRSPEPPAELFVALGAGGLATAGILLLLFGIPWLCRRSPVRRGASLPTVRVEPGVGAVPPAAGPDTGHFKKEEPGP
jgi:hypothetical protein